MVYLHKKEDSACTGGIENAFVVDESHKNNWMRYNIDDHCRTCKNQLNFGMFAYTKRGKPYCLMCALKHGFLDKDDIEFLRKETREAAMRQLAAEKVKTGFEPVIVKIGRKEIPVSEGHRIVVDVVKGYPSYEVVKIVPAEPQVTIPAM